MKRIFPFLMLLASANLSFLSAQTAFDDFRKKTMTEFQQYKTKRQQDFDAYRQACNSRYAEFLRQSWVKKDAEKPIPQPKKEEIPPVVFDDKTPIEIENEHKPVVEIVPPAPQPVPKPKPIAPIEENPLSENETFSFTFCGTPCQVRVSAGQRQFIPGGDKDAVADAWQTYSAPEYDNMLVDCLALREKLRLNDYAYFMLLDRFTADLFGSKGNSATLLTAYIFCQSGYKTRLASSADKLYLLFACDNTIFNRFYFMVGNDRYYSLYPDIEGSAQICAADMESGRPVSMSLAEQPRLAVKLSNARQLSSKRCTDIVASVRSNVNLIEFYNEYPVSMQSDNLLTRWALYADTPASPEMRSYLYPALQSAIQGLSELEKVGRLLDFVQTAFVYGYDDKVWGEDRAFFSDETLYYPYSDCEDRSILFSRLVRDLVHLDVALIYYPGHLAVAVHFNTPVNGDYTILGNRNYTICDPTYIGAPVGLSMPQLDNCEAQAILLER